MCSVDMHHPAKHYTMYKQLNVIAVNTIPNFLSLTTLSDFLSLTDYLDYLKDLPDYLKDLPVSSCIDHPWPLRLPYLTS